MTRSTPVQSFAAIPSVTYRPSVRRSKRGVFVSEHTTNGHRWVYSVDARGELVRLRTVIDTEEEILAASDELWRELDRISPMPTFVTAQALRHLRLME